MARDRRKTFFRVFSGTGDIPHILVNTFTFPCWFSLQPHKGSHRPSLLYRGRILPGTWTVSKVQSPSQHPGFPTEQEISSLMGIGIAWGSYLKCACLSLTHC